MRRLVQHHVGRRPFAARRARLAFQRAHRLVQPAQIHVEADGLRVSRLLAAQQAPGAAQLEVAQGDAIARSQIGMMLEHPQTFLRRRLHEVRHDQVAIGAAVTAPHAPAQLVELGEPELIRPVHDHRVGVGDVQPRLDDHRRHQHVHLTAHEARHHLVEIVLALLAVRHRDPRPRRERLHARRDRVDRLDAVVHEVHLAAAVQLARQRLLEQRVVPRLDEREHR